MKQKMKKKFLTLITVSALAFSSLIADAGMAMQTSVVVRADSAGSLMSKKKSPATVIRKKKHGIKGYEIKGGISASMKDLPKEPSLNCVLIGGDDFRDFFGIVEYKKGNYDYPRILGTTGSLKVKPGKKYRIAVRVMNCGKENAEGVRAAITLPDTVTPGQTAKLRAKLSGTNLLQNNIKNTLKITADEEVRLVPVKNSAESANVDTVEGMSASGADKIDLEQLLSEDGIELSNEYDSAGKMEGVIKPGFFKFFDGDYDYSSIYIWMTFKVERNQ